MKRSITLSSILLINIYLFSNPANAQTLPSPAMLLPEGYFLKYNPKTEHYYLYVEDRLNWETSKSYAESIGGYLVAINSQEENQWLYETFSIASQNSKAETWIGLIENEWLNGEPVEYKDFIDYTWGGSGFCVYYKRATHWWTRPKQDTLRSIVEFENIDMLAFPNPTSTPTPGLPGGYDWKYNPYNGHYYAYINQTMLWKEAYIFAQELGGYILTITDQQEHQWLNSTFSHIGVFLGLQYDGGWKWITGESFNYSNWSPSEPSGDGSIVEITSDGWNDRTDDHEKYFIVETNNLPDPTPILPENLVGYWNFDGNTMDSSGNNHNGLLKNEPVFVSDGYNTSVLKFDGVNDSVYVDASPKLTFSSDDRFTISLWFNLSSQTEGSHDSSLIASSPDSNYRTDYIYIDIQENNVRVHMEGDSSNENVAIHYYDYNYKDDKWHYLTLIHDINNVYLYIDNELKASHENHKAKGIYNSEGQWEIGHKPHYLLYDYFNGMIDDVRIYNTAVYPGSSTNLGLPEGYEWKYNPDTGNYYLYINKSNNWESAKSYAESLGGYLVSINSKQEDDWLYETFSEMAQYETWIGLDGSGWVSGEPVQYLNYIDPHWGGSGTCVFYMRSQNEKWWKRPKQDLIGFIVEYSIINPIPTPTPTPIAENWISLNGESLEDNSLIAGSPAGYAHGKIAFGDIPEGQGSDGTGMAIKLAPGQGVFISSSKVFETSSLVQLTGRVRANNKEASIALIGLNSPIDGQIGYNNIKGAAVPVDDYQQLNLIWAPPAGKVQYAIQAVNSPFATFSTTVWVDNIEFKPFEPTYDLEAVELAVDGDFNGGLELLMVNINDDDGTVMPFFESITDVALRFSLEPSNTAANVGTTCLGLYNQYPFSLLGQVSVKRSSIPGGGMIALVLTNGFNTLALYRNADLIKSIYDEQDEHVIIGGDFTTYNPDIPISAFVQLGGPGANASVVVDDLLIVK